jgi:putative ABC transport system permease protein
LIVAGASLCTPLAVIGVAALGHAWAGRLSPASRLAAANLGAAPRRVAVAVAALMVAIGMMFSFAILIGSFRTTVVAWADETLRADLFVRPLGLADASTDSRFSPRLAATLAATNLAAVAVRHKLRLLGGADDAALARSLPNSDRVLVSEPFATRFGVRAGDRLRLDTPSGPVDFEVAALYNDYSSDGGIVILDSSTFTKLFHDDSLNSLAIYATPGTDLQALRSRVIRSVLPSRIDVETTRELRALVVAIFNRTFAITYALYIISIAIAVLGIVTTLFALVLERRREIGLMRYLGLRASEVRSMILYEAAYIGALGGASGIAVGILLALLLIFVINRQAFGWLIELHVPWEFLAASFVLVIVAALLAGLYPARVAARVRTADAVRTE